VEIKTLGLDFVSYKENDRKIGTVHSLLSFCLHFIQEDWVVDYHLYYHNNISTSLKPI